MPTEVQQFWFSFVINRLLYFKQTTNEKQHGIGITYQASANLLSKYRHRPLKNPFELTTNHETATLNYVSQFIHKII